MTNLTVTRSLPRILKIGGKTYRMWSEDWETPAQAEHAASLCAVAVNSAADTTDPRWTAAHLPTLGGFARRSLGVDDSRPYGYSIIVEPIV